MRPTAVLIWRIISACSFSKNIPSTDIFASGRIPSRTSYFSTRLNISLSCNNLSVEKVKKFQYQNSLKHFIHYLSLLFRKADWSTIQEKQILVYQSILYFIHIIPCQLMVFAFEHLCSMDLLYLGILSLFLDIYHAQDISSGRTMLTLMRSSPSLKRLYTSK